MQKIKPIGLYHPDFEKDACGTGFVTSIDGVATHGILKAGIQCVCNVTHRGAVSADAKTGDGAGITTQIPEKFFGKILSQMKVESAAAGDLAVGVFFFPHDAIPAQKAKGIAEKEIREAGLTLIGWREVPVDPSALGAQALKTLPTIRHGLVRRPASIPQDAFDRKLFWVRRRIEKAWEAAGIEDGYIPSLSSKTIAYKGLLVAPQLTRFYPDLLDPDYETAIALFHQRYSTNTFPNWFLAQPFRFLAHNGEINTLQGNRNWMAAREPELSCRAWGEDLGDLLPIIQAGGSDSMSLDNVLELLVMSGRDVLHAMMMLVPDAWQGMAAIDAKTRAFYQYHAMLSEPWDGPAALTFTDGTIAGAVLDRNGLRPARYWITKDRHVILASEVGVVDVDPTRIVEKGRLGPGQVFAVDTVKKKVLRNLDVKRAYALAQPYQEWVSKSVVPVQEVINGSTSDEVMTDSEALARHQIVFGVTEDELQMFLEPMAKTGKEPVFSMGDDTPPAVLSKLEKPLFTYFKQLFAQVTNPPIDPIREELVMSLNTILGARPNLLEQGPAPKRLVRVKSPLLVPHEFFAIQKLNHKDLAAATISTLFEVSEGPSGLRKAVARIRKEAVKAVDKGATILILSDHGVDAEHVAVPSLLAVASVHHHLIRQKRRMKTSLVVEAGDVHEVHQVACLIGYGAAAVYPYIAFQTLSALHQQGKFSPDSLAEMLAHYRKALDQGVLKIMSKMGISTVGSYRGAQIFEAVGLSQELVQDCFPGTPSRVGGITYEHLAQDLLALHKRAYHREGPLHLDVAGFYQYRRDGEYHAFNPTMVKLLQEAVKANSYELYKRFADTVNNRPPTALHDLLDVKPLGKPIPIDQAEPIEAITRRFATASISYGALSLEAHETLAMAMNRIGGKSGSGEGGEDPSRYRKIDPERNRNSYIKQVASGRFGVTPEYLMSAREIEIKMAQGSKPGEGGQLPGHKVSVEIARVRHTIPGVTLISPPPHHDIYSIEDLAQLIYDLKMINPDARVTVKLVSEAGVGTIAAGVAKAYADNILISGCDGGTGASPLSSIKNAGLPWELGIAEAQQTLRLNDLRRRVILRADGGMKTGRDVLIAALFGAEEYGFGTAPLVATGCVMTRKCHLNTCPVGVATQDEKWRKMYRGTVEMLVNYMTFIAQEVRETLAALGARSLEEVIGRTELLTRRKLELSEKAKTIDLSFLTTSVDVGPRYHTDARNDRPGENPLDNQIIKDAQAALEGRGKIKLSYPIRNTNRTVGARLAGVIAKRYMDEGLPAGTIDITLTGVAGQSFGAFAINGMRLALIGEANDYVGKGMSGGELVIRPPEDSPFAWQENAIIGNTCLYGATGGVLYAAGRAGERFGVRNSGAMAVVEGVGDHGCEYMTGGMVLILGATGRNFGAGMTGGCAYVLDVDGEFQNRVNLELVQLARLEQKTDIDNVRTLLERHFVSTKSPFALELMSGWDQTVKRFWVVEPRGTGVKLERAVVLKEG